MGQNRHWTAGRVMQKGVFKLLLMDIKKHSTTFHEHMESKTQEQSEKKEKKK